MSSSWDSKKDDQQDARNRYERCLDAVEHQTFHQQPPTIKESHLINYTKTLGNCSPQKARSTIRKAADNGDLLRCNADGTVRYCLDDADRICALIDSMADVDQLIGLIERESERDETRSAVVAAANRRLREVRE